MASPSYYTDGTPGFGTNAVVINAVSYIADTITVERPIAEAEDFTAVGVPQRKRVTQLRSNGSMSLQIDSTTARPQMGQTFTETFDANFGSETWVVKQVGVEQSNDAGTLRKVPVTFDKVYVSITTTA